MWPRKPDHDDMAIYGDGSYGRVVEDPFPPGTLAYLQPHEYPDAERLERIRSIIPESALSDYDVTEPAQGRPVFTDRATGLQYLRDDSDPLLAPQPAEHRHHHVLRRCGREVALLAAPWPASAGGSHRSRHVRGRAAAFAVGVQAAAVGASAAARTGDGGPDERVQPVPASAPTPRPTRHGTRRRTVRSGRGQVTKANP